MSVERPFFGPGLSRKAAPVLSRGIGLLVLSVVTLMGGLSDPTLAESWRSARPMETARSNSGIAVHGGEIYVAGGASVLGPRDVFEVFDPYSDSWRPLPALPMGLERFGMATLGNKIYISGGYGEEALEPRNELWVFDVATSRWTQGPDLPSPRAGHTMVALGTKLYVIGGLGAGTAPVLIFDQTSQSWETSPWRLPTARGDLVAVTDGKSRIYVVGGRTDKGPVARADMLDVAQGDWTRLNDMPRARAGHTVALIRGQLHVTGGVAKEALKTYAEHDVLDLAGGRWTSATPLPTPRHGLVSATIDDRWYVIGGGAGAGFFTVFTEAGSVEIYEP